MIRNNELEEFITKYFPDLQLRIPLYYNWGLGIRFELNTKTEFGADRQLLHQIYSRAITIFEDCFVSSNGIWFLVRREDDLKITRRGRFFAKYLHSETLAELRYIKINDSHYYGLKCKYNNIRYKKLLQDLANFEMGIKPATNEECFFINIDQKIIFNMYDDRGVDVIGPSIQSIRELYLRHDAWILDYDREKIDCLFKC